MSKIRNLILYDGENWDTPSLTGWEAFDGRWRPQFWTLLRSTDPVALVINPGDNSAMFFIFPVYDFVYVDQ